MSKSGFCLIKHGNLIDKERVKREADALMADDPALSREFAMTKVAQGIVTALKQQETVLLNGGSKVLASSQAERFYSALKRAFIMAPDKVFGNPAQVKAWLAGNAAKYDVKKDEVYWSGINDWLDMQTGKVSRDDVLQFMEQNGVQVEDVVLGGEKDKDRSQRLWDAANKELSRFGDAIRKQNLPLNINGREYFDDDLIYELEDGLITPEDLREDLPENIYVLAKNWIALRDEAENDPINSTSVYKEPKHDGGDLVIPGGTDYRELVVTIPTTEKFNESDSTHFGDVGKGKQIAWVRHNTRTDADGNKTLFLEEVQSQRGAEGRKHGFQSNIKDLPEGFDVREKGFGEYAVFYPDGRFVYGTQQPTAEEARQEWIRRLVTEVPGGRKGVPPAPFVTDANNKATNAYISLLLKKAISAAIDNGQTSVSWTTGDQQADRYDLSKQVDSITYDKNKDGTYYIAALKDNSIMHSEDHATIQKIEELVGKDIARKIENNEGHDTKSGEKELSGLDLKVGGGWTQAMYGDENGLNAQVKPSLIMQAAGEIARKMGGKVGSIRIHTHPNSKSEKGRARGFTSPALIITPEMRDKILNEGMPLFSFAGEKAATADKFNRSYADDLLNRGYTKEEVRQETGWLKGVDGMWRYEISDHDAEIKKPFPTKGQLWGDIYKYEFKKQVEANDIRGLTVGDLLDHPRLFAAYPQLKDLSVSTKPGDGARITVQGGDNPLSIDIGEEAPMYEVKSILLHELQHGIQAIEGFARGGSTKAIVENPEKYVPKELIELAKSTTAYKASKNKEGFIKLFAKMKIDNPYMTYHQLAGEVEARNTQARAKMDDNYRRMVPPSETADVQDSDVIVSWNGKEVNNMEAPANSSENPNSSSLPFTIMIDGKQRPTTNSNGKLIAQTEEGVRNFWKWFGDSKVVDKQGRPLVVYHGTNEGDIDEFYPSNSGALGKGSYFSSHSGEVNEYGNITYPVYLSINNPYLLKKDDYRLASKQLDIKIKKGGHDGGVRTWDDDPTKHYTALNPNQIKSAIGNNGQFDPENNDIRFSMADTARDAINAVKDSTDSFNGIIKGFDTLTNKAKNNVYALATQRQLVDLGKRYFSSMPKYLQARTAMNVVVEKLMNESDGITKKWEQLVKHSEVPFKDKEQKQQNKEMQKKLADVMHYATIYGQDPRRAYNGDPTDMEAIANHEQVSSLYRGLNDNARTVFDLAARDHQSHMQTAIELMRNNVEKSAASRAAKDAMLSSLDNTLKESSTIYFPLSRFGEYWLYYEQDGVNYFNMFETESELNAFKKHNPDIDIESEGVKFKNMKSIDGVSGDFLSNVGKLLEEISNPDEKAKIQDAMYQLYLKTLPDLSARKHFIHRKKTAGFHEDALRGFASKAFHDAKMIGRLQYKEVLKKHIDDMNEAVKAAQSRKSRKGMANRLYLLSALRDGDEVKPDLQDEFEDLRAEYQARDGRDIERYELISDDIKSLENVLSMADNIGKNVLKSSRIMRELELSHDAMMNPVTAGWASMLNGVGFLNFLGFSPSAALVNTLQTPTVSLPYMAAQHGFMKTASKLNDAFKEFYSSEKNADGHMSMEKGLSGDDARAFQVMLDRGILTRTRSMDLIGLGEEGINAGSTRRKLMYASAYMFNRAEVMNREITGMAAFRLAMDKHHDFDAAIAYADEVINTTHGDYTGDNRSRIMRGNGARVALQFKQYSQLMTYNWGKAALDAIGVTKKKMQGQSLTEEDRQAVRLLLGMVAMQGSAAGLMGLPIGGIMIAAQLLADAAGDDDEPIDVEAELKAFIYEYFPDTLNINDAIVRGPLTAWTGIDLHSRVKQSDMWMREPDRDLEGQYGMSYLAETFGGPIAGIMASMLDAKGMINDGHVMRGVEKMLPKAIKDPITATRFIKDGARNMRGDLIEDINIFEAIAKAGGFNSADLAQQYDQNSIKKRVEGEYKKRRSYLVDVAATARIDGDSEAFDAAWADIEQWNATNPELNITKATLLRSVMSRKATSRRMDSGVLVDNRLKEKLNKFNFNEE